MKTLTTDRRKQLFNQYLNEDGNVLQETNEKRLNKFRNRENS